MWVSINKTVLSIAFIAFAACLFVTKPANAILMLSLDDGLGNTANVTDTDGDGFVNYTDSLGSWLFNVTSGFANPAIGDDKTNALALNSVNVSGGEGELTIMLTNTDYTGFASMTSYLTHLAVFTTGSVLFQSYLDTTNAAFGMETLLSETGILSDLAYSSNDGGSVMTSDLYSLTSVAKISHSSFRNITAFGSSISVPEPTSLTLFVIGLVSLGFTRRRKKT